MTRLHWLRRVLGASACAIALLAAASAYGAGAMSYRGTTSQGRAISFTVERGYVTGLAFRIIDRCSDGEGLLVHNFGFPPIKISHNAFAVTSNAHPGEPTVVHGQLSGNHVRGSLHDTTVYLQNGDVCTGTTTFVAHRH